MFGLFRYGLAVLVLVTHLWPQLARPAGAYAVFGFYTLSGYLMAYVLRHVYGTDAEGVRRFLVNRFLRIYPPYWCVMAATLLIFLVHPLTGPFLNPAVRLPPDLPHWLANLVIFGLDPGLLQFQLAAVRLVPPAWSLHVELSFYLLMALVLVRREWTILLWLSLSATETLMAMLAGLPWPDRYFPLIAASLPFALGATIQLLHERRQARGHGRAGAMAAALFMLHALASRWLYGNDAAALGMGLYLSLALAACVVWALGPLRGSTGIFARLDRWAGDMSYPLFLVHVITAMAISSAFGLKQGAALFFSTLVAATLLAFALHVTLEQRIARIRAAIRKRSASP